MIPITLVREMEKMWLEAHPGVELSFWESAELQKKFWDALVEEEKQNSQNSPE